LPDVAGNADPDTGYQIFLAGSQQVIGGTSAVAPLMAGLIALINQSLAQKTPGTTAGFLNPLLYGSAAAAFRDITTGNNDIYGKLKGLYTAGPGWDACSGLGVPDGTKLLASVV
jgi:kumamolisin